MKLVSFASFVLVALSLLVTSCKVKKEDEAPADARYSKAELFGRYEMSLATCTEGQFDSKSGAGFLNQNRKMSDLWDENRAVRVQIGRDLAVTTAPALLYGSDNRNCLVTTTERISYPNNQSIVLQMTSRECSDTCSVEDCEEDLNLRNQPSRRYFVVIKGSTLKLVDQANRNACISRGKRFPAQYEFVKE